MLTVLVLFFCTIANAQLDTTINEPEGIAEPVDENKVTDEEEDDEDEDYSVFTAVRSYDSFKVQERTVPRRRIDELKQETEYWYANGEGKKGDRTAQPKREVPNGNQRVPEEKEPSINYNRISDQPWFQTIMWILIVAGFAGAIIWYLTGSNVGLFRKRDKKITDSATEEMPEDIFAINYQKEIDKAAAQGNYRLAIRLMYLRLLKNLSEKNIISYKQDRTNLDYLMQLHPTAFYKDFFRITRHYEFSWYGEFTVSSEAYTIVKREFDDFEKTTG
jgi:hypothetical protein